MPTGDTLAVWIGFFVYANYDVSFPEDSICFPSKVYRMSVNRLESKQKEFGDHLGDGTCKFSLRLSGMSSTLVYLIAPDKSSAILNSCHCF